MTGQEFFPGQPALEVPAGAMPASGDAREMLARGHTTVFEPAAIEERVMGKKGCPGRRLHREIGRVRPTDPEENPQGGARRLPGR